MELLIFSDLVFRVLLVLCLCRFLHTSLFYLLFPIDWHSIQPSRHGIQEDETRSLVYLHGKSQSHIVGNFFTKVVASFSSERYSGFVFEISLADTNDARKW